MDTAALATLTSPVVLFFVLGLLAAAARSDLAIPEAIAKALSIYLMIAIGLKGGVAIAQAGVDATAFIALAAGVGASFTIPFLAYAVLRGFGRLNQLNSGAVAAHYGSVSVVTFVTASEILTAAGTAPAGYMVAVLAAMETPAILSGIYLARRGAKPASPRPSTGNLWHEVFLNASVVLLLGSLAIGVLTGPQGYAEIAPVFDAGFRGVLCLFLLDMGLIAARRLRDSRAITARLVAFAILFPVLTGALGVSAATAIGLDPGSAAAFGVLCASASYIAVPAAIRLAVPQADPGIYLTLSLSISFPFNILINIGLLTALARLLGG
jgi:uncharacterized protein